jgi:hypothetical protein
MQIKRGQSERELACLGLSRMRWGEAVNGDTRFPVITLRVPDLAIVVRSRARRSSRVSHPLRSTSNQAAPNIQCVHVRSLVVRSSAAQNRYEARADPSRGTLSGIDGSPARRSRPIRGVPAEPARNSTAVFGHNDNRRPVSSQTCFVMCSADLKRETAKQRIGNRVISRERLRHHKRRRSSLPSRFTVSEYVHRPAISCWPNTHPAR